MTNLEQHVKEFMEAAGFTLLDFEMWKHPKLERLYIPEEAIFMYRLTLEARRDELNVLPIWETGQMQRHVIGKRIAELDRLLEAPK